MSTVEIARPDPEKQAVLEGVLERAAEQLGDITPLVLDAYYAEYPEAKKHFEHHGVGSTARLEQDMVESGLYSLMVYYERPAEIEIMLANAVPHHEFLDIPLDMIAGLQIAVVDVVEGTVPDTEGESKAVMADLKKRLVEMIYEVSRPVEELNK